MSLSADEYKQQGNAAFSAKEYENAIDLFTKAIEVSETPNHVLYSNRSATYSSMKKFADALTDAEECIKINPTWSKGYNRKGAAHFGLGNLDEAEVAYKKALELDASNKAAQDGLDQVHRTQESRSAQPDMGLSKLFADPNLIENLKKNPKTAELMNDPTLVAKLINYKANPQAIGTDLFSDPRLMTIMATLMGVDLNMPDLSNSNSMPKEPTSEPKETPKEADTKQTPEPASEEPEPMEVDEEDKSKAEADLAKAEGNKAYKAHKFDEAIAQYNKAFELHKDITYLNNRSAAEFEKGDYETAINTLNEAVEQGRDLRADYKIIAKSFARMGNSYYKLNDLQKAIEYYQKSLTEHRTADILTKLRTAEKELKTKEATDYVNPEKAEEARLQGKEYFTKADWPKAVEAYTEMIKRAPEDARGYSNRAAALAKLMSFPSAIEDCDKAIQKDPNFIRAYIRKANAQIAVKEFSSALETLDEARSKDAATNNGSNSKEIDQLYYKASSQRFQPAEGNETPEQVYQRAMKDPEVQRIMQDPVIQSILSQAQSDPAALQEHMKNPEVFKKIQTLIAAGIIQTGRR
ncbi:similar to Saccharomyces cerevisiae YOR027W STI1 Hsp90 cochaperone, interacts with the Ssa group of the cytosolic Hsp70 chaperones and activates Ssa1p ATPase activity [Maudiozyma barnettii]|uniref:Similar to Saccharomyces cerevisiae YOR027W STI1 Hsp90 cochaperone, interacts with the Ssa group of the cytosolic Hsp70 chaperones and activates Ssa1p ATPase activity n=1 Tax=Maudiozyma barnettii TaxID=61262 RepID=A0A8H2VJ48_9SACH|nr:Hsp90 cochaperone STI1 [Kazachstania barnettii]CAB4256305.1 similar to Saccharomyces cerevisiae YOR027W STI1 Hsp90 cochaperone, interacts with the Ssa group of the cytosolic Hsp70 chaperones and activates Ssa1p ATPase activity [Kazachstania barnettii]CAD1784914.1 similar to Saccharomyces cerevisiae YOR027W STI1 Hsp90 cochaperone, interacts with the Ssa group of the cytosolic Hsp70 chaperones and activates Ssa1p ATPase activity [Kazachstania barnettii]